MMKGIGMGEETTGRGVGEDGETRGRDVEDVGNDSIRRVAEN